MGWEIAALWIDEPEASWCRTWRRVEDDSGRIIEESRKFEVFEECLEDARAHGFDHADCAFSTQDC
jgi:hypothetical protein